MHTLMPKCAFGLRQLKTIVCFCCKISAGFTGGDNQFSFPIHPSLLPPVLLFMRSSVLWPVLDPAIIQRVY